MKLDKSKVRSAGKVISVQGPVVDIRFGTEDEVPEVFEKVILERVDKEEVILEVTEHVPGNIARCIAINATMNVRRGTKAYALGIGIQIPVGQSLYGRLINVLGEPMDEKGDITSVEYLPIRRPEMGTRVSIKKDSKQEAEILETGIKIIDLLFALSLTP